MKFLRFLGFLAVLFGMNFGVAFAATTGTSGFGTPDNQVCDGTYCYYCDDNGCYVCDDPASNPTPVCRSYCANDEYGAPGETCSSCSNYNSNYALSVRPYNRAAQYCFRNCGTCNTISDSTWAAYFGSTMSQYFSAELFARDPKSPQLPELLLLNGNGCDMGTNYCTYNVSCETTSSACKPGHVAVEFRDANNNLIKTLYTVNRSAWSTQNTQVTPNPGFYSDIVYPTFVTPTAPTISGKNFLGWYDAQTGGNQVIAPASNGAMYGDLTFNLANTYVAGTPRTLYAQYEDVVHTINLLPNGGSPTNTIYHKGNGFYCDENTTIQITSGQNIFTRCNLTKPSLSNNEFTGYWASTSGGTKYIDSDGKILSAASGVNFDGEGGTRWYAQYQSTTTTVKCNCGYYVPTGATSCVQCPVGSYCPEGIWTVPANFPQGIVDCAKDCSGAISNAGACNVTQCYKTCDKECYKPNDNCPTQGANDCGYDTSITVAGRIYLQSDGSCGTSCDYAILPANSSNNWCPITSCPANYYFTSNKICIACDTGFSAPAGSTGPENCTKTCLLNCVKPDCPAAILAHGHCEYGNQTGSGTMNQVDLECVGTAPTCSITPNCYTGYVPHLTNDACIAATYTITYEKNGGDWPDDSYCPGGTGCPSTYTYGSEVTINGVPVRDNSEFVGWCTDSSLTNCSLTQTISQTATENKIFYAKWKCVAPYHQNATGDACEACPDDYYYDPNSATLCSACPTSFPHSTRPFNWSEDQCWHSCTNAAACEMAPAALVQNASSTCTAKPFMTTAGTQIEFKGNAGNANANACDATNVPFCPYGFECSAESVDMPRWAPATFRYGTDWGNSALRYVFGLGRWTTNGGVMTDGQTWSAIMGPAQYMSFPTPYDAYTFIIYPTDTAPDATVSGHTFTGYYGTQTGGTQYVESDYGLDATNAQSIGVTLDNEIPGNRNLYAHYDESVYHITYEKNGGDWAPMSNCPGASGCPATYTYGTGATINVAPTRALSVFAGWCTDSALTNCALLQTIGTNETGDKTFYAKWECVEPYHQNAAGTMCEACDDNQYWGGSGCLNCGEGAAAGFPFSKSPFNWSVDQCYRDCPNATCLSDGNLGSEFPSSCNIVGFSNSNRQVDFKGNHDNGVNSCDAVQYCPYGLMHCDIAEAFKPMTVPVDFYGKIPQELIDTYYIFGKRANGDSIDLGTANVWSQIVGPAQKGPVNHNTIGGQPVDYQYTYIFYPTYTAPNADVPGYTFTGYYHPQTGGTQYVNQSYALNMANAQSVISGITGYDSNTARPLYANLNNGYTPNNYVATYKCGAGQGADMNDPNSATYGQTYTVLGLGDTNCSYTGHTFLGWVFSGNDNTYSGGDTLTWNYPANQTFTAQWSGANDYIITYKPNYTGATQSDQTQNVTYGQPFTTLGAVFTRPGYRMTAWSEPFPLLGHEYQSYNIAGNTTLLAQWEQCPAGTYWDNGTCAPCPENTTSPAGSTSVDQCVPCGDGYYLNNVTCEDCPGGYPHSDPNATQQSQCYQNCETPCTEPVSCPVPNAATCTYGANPNPGHLYYGAQACDAVALTCPVSAFTCLPGYVVNATGDACEPCPEGTIPNASGTACEPCPAGTFWNDGTCEPCPEGYTSNPGATSVDQCFEVCAPGQHFMHGECEDDEVSCTACHKCNPHMECVAARI